MIATSPSAWLTMLVMVLLASAAGIAVARLWLWEPAYGSRAVALWWGVGLGPFILGLASVLMLWLMPGASHVIHLAVVAGLLTLVAGGGWRFGRMLPQPMPSIGSTGLERVLWVMVLAWCAGLMLNTMFIPLSQNDSLEYATVGRILFDARTLLAYPAIHPDQTASGFYGPWTHPPLYVALIYIVDVMQVHADTPGLMRLIAPWSLIAATGLVYALGATVGRLVALLSAMIFISTPLLFLGAESALLDSLPVLGFALVISTIVLVRGSSWHRGLAVGGALGLALWSHSQAVLFVPLACVALVARHGWLHWRAWLAESAVMVGVAVLFGAWPYIRNVFIFGTPISDNPAVFSLPELAWGDYFSIGRGLNTWPAVVQYGWLKGWFAVEAYGLAFWLMLLGLLTLMYAWRRREPLPPLLRVAAATVGCYLLAMLTSTLLGLDLMIKNERYMLVIIPFVALLAGAGVARLLATRSITAAPVALLVCGIGAVQLVGLVGYRFIGNGLTLENLGRPLEQTLYGRPEYLVVDYLRKHTPPDALVFSLKPADMYYSGRRMLSYLDPRLLPFYREGDPARAQDILLSHGVKYVHIPDYGLPPMANGPLQAVLRNPAWATLIYQSDGNQIYALRNSGLKEGAAQDLLAVAWWRSTSLVVGGRKALANLYGKPNRIDPSQTSRGGGAMGLFHRELSTLLSTGLHGNSSPLPSSDSISVEGGAEYALDLDLEGSGLVRVWLQSFGADGHVSDKAWRSQSRILLTDLTLGGSHPHRSFARRLRMLPAARNVVVTLEHVGTSELRVRRARLVLLAHS